jgi:DNA modification methylase
MRDNADNKYPLDQLRHIEGFPIGEDEDLHALSDPPHYTAYPNPHIAEFIAKWGKPYDEATDDYHREPYVADVSEGKNDPIYNAHSYHTKVPHKAIMRFIRHYTEPGDIVFDGFCGTGMTGVAAQMLGRRAILVDLSPAATFIAYNYNTPVDTAAFEREAKRILREVEAECGWMYETWHPHCDHHNRVKGRINYTVWSDVFVCPYCRGEIVFLDAAVDSETRKVRKAFLCPSCGAEVTKRDLARATDRVYDSALGQQIERGRQTPALINYSVGRKRYEKKPDVDDMTLIRRIEESEIPYWVPNYPMMFRDGQWGDQWRVGYHTGMSHSHHFYTKRNLWTLAKLVDMVRHDPRFLILVTSVGSGLVSKLTRYNLGKRGNGPRAGTLYVPSLIAETNVVKVARSKLRDIARMSQIALPDHASVATQSSGDLNNIPKDTLDYIFTDPPFGDNLVYAELNFLSEAWLKVFTNSNPEAIISKTQKKALDDYRLLMTHCFAEMYRVLKPGRWITVVFHNSKASVWNAIQDGLARAGFLVAQVTVMDKKQGTFNQVGAPGAVKNDLIINAYKPRKSFEERFLQRAGYGLEQEFIAQHLGMLPVEPNLERTAQMLYSKMLAYYVQHGYEITLNADQFYRLLGDHFLERDGYWFHDEEQVQEYERRKLMPKTTKGAKGAKVAPLAQRVLFISDERSAIAWLHHFLETPRNYTEIYTAFVKALQVPEDQIPEIKTLLEENFVRVNGQYKRPELLEKQELEARRQQRLLREFDDILEQARRGQRLKDVRKEAVLAGFAQCYREKRFQDILRVGRRLHKRIVESSTEIYDFIDIAEAKVG